MKRHLACALLLVSVQAHAQTPHLQLPGSPASSAISATEVSSRLNLAEGRLASLEKKFAALESALAKAQQQLGNLAADNTQTKATVQALKDHTHEVFIYSVDHGVTKVKDVYNIEKTVVVPGPSFGNPKGSTGAPKAGAGSPF
ncbi:MAG: hypothetical protein JNM76_02465 [Betaproteobacteria bacterium]|nr:hypothetical protein [Betaproteobacteria bacterium]